MDKIYRIVTEDFFENKVYKTLIVLTVFERIYEYIDIYKKFYEDQYTYTDMSINVHDLNSWIEKRIFVSNLNVEKVENEVSLQKVSYIKNTLFIKPKTFEYLFQLEKRTKRIFLFFKKEYNVEVICNDRRKVTEFETKWEVEKIEYLSTNVKVEEDINFKKTIIRG